LKADDFTVQEEGQAQAVRAFSFHQTDQEPASASAQASAFVNPKLPPGYFSNAPQYKSNGALNVLLLDALNSTLLNQASMRDGMIKLIEKLPAGQPIAIYLLGNKLTLVQDFTSDPEVLRKAVAGVKRQGSKLLDNAAGTTRMDDMPVGSVLFDAMTEPPSIRSKPTLKVPWIRAKLEDFREQKISAQADFRVRLSLDALNSLARALSGYPDRKNLIWISETFPFTIVIDTTATPSDRRLARIDQIAGTTMNTASLRNGRDFSHEIALTGSLLSDAQVAIYPINVEGLSGNTDFSVGNDPNPIGKPAIMKSTLDDEAGKNMNREAEGHMVSRSTMNDLAEKTGGKAYYNTNNIEGAVRRSMEDGSTYYTLGYYPENKTWDGKFRRITIKVARPGVKLHYRAGYYAVEPQSYAKLDQAEKTNELAKAMSLDFPASTALFFQAMVVPPSTATGNKVLVNYAVDPHGLTFDLGNDGLQHASVDCAVIVYSEKNEPVKSLSNTMIAALKPEEYQRVQQKSFPCRQTFDLAPGEYLFRLGVRDGHTGTLGTLNAPVTIPPPSQASQAQPADKKP
ncbi:MAG TPA: VWA domain-containing protein, partial [Alphaproteobacteria bacterium]|nr:VWA domain-containing protein [Alphaproteobacteria bacterium]